MKRADRILHFAEINQAHAAMGFAGRTDLPEVHAFDLAETYPTTRRAMPPYTFGFYCVTLLENSDDATLTINENRRDDPSDTVSFQSPGHVVAWVRGAAQRGGIVYFRPEFLGHRPIPLLEEFPFFRPTEPNLLPLEPGERAALRDHFARLTSIFRGQHPYRPQLLQAFLLALLFDCKGLYEGYHARQEDLPRKAALAARFQALVEQHYLTRQMVRAYAELLAVTPNHLSQAVSGALGRGAHEVIAARVLLEAKKLLRHTQLPVAEVSDYLGFAEPTHFTRFFRREVALTPLAYRRGADNLPLWTEREWHVPSGG